MDFPDHPFWDFSLETYGAAGVAPACLALQERHKLDVNFLLFCCWLGRAGYGAQGDGRIARLHDAVIPWHRDVVRGLRAVRARLKQPFPDTDDGLRLALRKRLAGLEIDAEHVEQLTLAAALGDLAPDRADPDQAAAEAMANLASYFAVAGYKATEEDREAMETVLQAAFPTLEPARIGALCQGFGNTGT